MDRRKIYIRLKDMDMVIDEVEKDSDFEYVLSDFSTIDDYKLAHQMYEDGFAEALDKIRSELWN